MKGMNSMVDADTTRAPSLVEGTIELPASDAFLVRDAVKLGTRYGKFTVTYVGPNFLRRFGDVEVSAQPPRLVRHVTLAARTDDEALAVAAGGADALLADLFAVLRLGDAGPGRFNGESVTVYQSADGSRWTPHFYTRGRRLGFGALPFGDAVGWEADDVFLFGVRS